MSERITKVELCNMCMVMDEPNHKVLVLDKVGVSWAGLTFPGGHVDPGESIAQSAVREVKEETGLDVHALTACGLVDWYNIDTHARFHIYLFRTSCYAGELLGGTEEGRVFWMDLGTFAASALAPNMETYLKLFLSDTYREAFIAWDDSGRSEPVIL